MALRGRAAAAAVARFIAGGALRRSSAALASFGFRPASSAAASADERRAPESLLGMGETALTRLARDMGQPSYRGKQMHDAIYNMRKYSVDDMTQLPGPFRAQLTAAGVVVGRRAPVEVVSSPDGTKKVLIELHCGSIIEAVGIPEEMEEARAAANAAEGFPLYEDGDELEDSDALEDAFGDDDPVNLEADAEGDGWVRLGRLKSARDRGEPRIMRAKYKPSRPRERAAEKNEGKPRRRRFTVCVSSQVGCAMRCSFCATGRQGFRRNLDAAEIVNQVLVLEDVFDRRATNVVMMGMGEPLMNLREVLRAHRCLNRDVGIGGRYFTVSTVGVPNALSKLAAHRLQATLAVSLHAPDQALRERLIPSAKAYPLDALLEDCRLYTKHSGRRVTFEYTLLAGENDSPEHARALAKLLRSKVGRGCHVNLLPWNPVRGAEEDHRRPSKSAVSRFVKALRAERGVTHTVRRTRGLEADAACGQLTGAFIRKQKLSSETRGGEST